MTPLILHGSDISSKNYAWLLDLQSTYRKYNYAVKQLALPPKLSLSAVGDWQEKLDGRWQASFEKLTDAQEFQGRKWLFEHPQVSKNDLIALYILEKTQAIFADIVLTQKPQRRKLPYTVPRKWLDSDGLLKEINASKRIIALCQVLEAIKLRQGQGQGHEFAFVLGLLGEQQLQASRRLRQRVLALLQKGTPKENALQSDSVYCHAYQYQCHNIILQCFLVAFLETFGESSLRAHIALLRNLQV